MDTNISKFKAELTVRVETKQREDGTWIAASYILGKLVCGVGFVRKYYTETDAIDDLKEAMEFDERACSGLLEAERTV